MILSSHVMSDKLADIVKTLYIEYQDNPVIFQKFIDCIEQLPEVLKSTNDTIINRENRKNKLVSESEKFINKFLYTHKFFYHVSSELFFQYRDNKFYLIKEDDVQHTILTNISANKLLMDWKHKLKIKILKQIKETDIFSCIPESETIQCVINKLCPVVFDNREKSKYFLTVLGDILLKKCSLVYFINPKAKQWLKELSHLACMLFGTQTLTNIFKFKYYDHTFTDCRILDIQESINIDNWINEFKQGNGLDLFCVAAYYSTRYGSGDIFLQEHCKDEQLKTYALYLKDNTESNIIDYFCEKNIETSDDCSVSWKDMQYLWKHYVDSEKLPNVFFTSTLKTLLMNKFTYNTEKDVFSDCTSKLLPKVSKFLNFWNDKIVTDENSSEELEIDELCSLFAYQYKSNISEKNMLDLIKHYYPDTFIENDKYLLNTSCLTWNKKQDIINSLKKYKTNASHIEIYSNEIPINELYQFYSGAKHRFTTSKRYFENFIKEESQLFIVEDNFIKVNSFENLHA